MIYKPGANYYVEFTTQRFDTGAAVNADSLPVATANVNGTDDGAFVLTVANIDTGRYKISGTVPVGYTAGTIVNVSVAATINSVSGKAVVDTFTIDTKYVSDVDTVTAKLNTMLEADGLNYRYTTGALVNAPGGGAGTLTVTLRTELSSHTAVPECTVYIYNESDQVVAKGLTDLNGDGSIILNTGTFAFKAIKAGYYFDLVTDEITEETTITLTGSALSISAPPAGTQTLAILPEDPSLLLDDTATITAVIDGVNNLLSDSSITRKEVEAVNATTHFELTLGKGLQVWIKGETAEGEFLSKRITVSNDNTATLADY